MNVLIVESAAKARMIQKYLGSSEWVVRATGGHVQDLPSRDGDPKEGGKAFWASNEHALPSPPWTWTENGETAFGGIVEAARKCGATRFFLASDPDREGEFIAWRLSELLQVHGAGQIARVVFQEVTSEAIHSSLADPRAIDMDLVNSALVRRFLDRLVGFRTSKMAHAFLGARARSMGRVQTPTLGIIVDRELEREAHVAVPYFEVSARAAGLQFEVRFHEPADVNRWKDENNRFQATRTHDASMAQRAYDALIAARSIVITRVARSERTHLPRPPFTTDALLQAAGGRWGWSPKRTNAVASALYEAGHITYIRTDSTRLAQSAVDEARKVVTQAWGSDHLGSGAVARTGAGKVQDAHEAIRPTRPAVIAPEGVDADGRRLYELVRAQLLASQMAPARQAQIHLSGAVEGLDLPLTGTVSWYVDLGWKAAFVGIDEEAPTAGQPGLEIGSRLPLSPGDDKDPNPHLVAGQTQPPARYRAHTLIKAMKDFGIGRPSTYASTVETLLERGYVLEEAGALVPTSPGRTVWLEIAPMYELPDGEPLFDVRYTALMETRLDEVAEGVAPAPPVWIDLRDAVRKAHDGALKLKKSGKATPAQIALLERLLAVAPDAPEAALDRAHLTWEAARAAIQALHERGVVPAASEKQRAEIDRLLARTGVAPDEAASAAGLETLEALRTSREATLVIDFLRERLPAVTPPSERQLRFVKDLATRLGLGEAEACARVGSDSFAALTGGQDGTASELISLLKKALRQKK